MKYIFILFSFLPLIGFSQSYPVDTIMFNGNSSKLINLVILGDGYQQNELSKFRDDATVFSNALFSESPFKEYKNYFNVFFIKVASVQSGADHAGTATDVTEPVFPVLDVNTFYDARFDAFNIHRLLVANQGRAFDVASNSFPQYDQIVLLANSEYYGGSGGAIAVSSTNISANEVAIHEIGHSFAGLSDEYWAGPQYAYENVNMTQETDPEKVKWKEWLNDFGIGIYEYKSGIGWYRPHQHCKMRALNNPFCSVCRERIVERIHQLVNPTVATYPESNQVAMNESSLDFSIDLIYPEPNTLKVVWVLDGNNVGNNENLTLDCSQLENTESNLTVLVEDTTSFLRIDGHTHVYSNSWNIKSNQGVNTEFITICSGSSYVMPDGSVFDDIVDPFTYTSNVASNDCDSVTVTHIAISDGFSSSIDADICSGMDYTFPDGFVETNISVSFTHASKLKSQEGCDSIISTNINVIPVDIAVNLDENELSATANAENYQWLNCNNDFSIIEKATNQIFAPLESGNYAVEVTQNNCVDTSECQIVDIVSVSDFDFQNVVVYPNPTNGNIHLDLGQTYSNVEVIISDVLGQVIFNKQFENLKYKELQLGENSGSYFITIILGGNKLQYRIVKMNN